MSAISLANKVVIVTGAGRGLGREYALQLAKYGARVVVNDLGTGVDGQGSSPLVANEVVELIRTRGGEAIANCADVASEEGGQALVQQALDEFGALDVVVNNAGIGYELPFGQTTLKDYEHLWRIHVGGHINVSRAAWTVMATQKHGKIIMTCSGAGLFGLRNLAAYSSAKGAIHGLMRTMAVEGADHGIRVNCVSPGGFTRMQEATLEPAFAAALKAAMPVELAAPGIVWLASDDCTLTGQNFSLWGGRIAKIAIGSGHGLTDRQLTPEKIAGQLDAVLTNDGYFEPGDGSIDVGYWFKEMGVMG